MLFIIESFEFGYSLYLLYLMTFYILLNDYATKNIAYYANYNTKYANKNFIA